MFTKIKTIGKNLGSLKGKLLLLFLMIVFVMGGISISAYLSMKSVNNKLNIMAEATISANNLKVPAGEVRELLSSYFMDKTEQGRLAIEKKIAQISDQINQLKKYVHDEEGLSSIDSITGLMTSYGESINKAIDILKKNREDVGKEYLAQSDEVKKINGFLNDEIQNLITKELGYYQKLKTDLDRATAFTGLMVLIAIIAVGVLTAIGAFIYLNKVIGALTKVANSAADIAGGNLRITELKVKSRDEVSILAQSFNKMGAN